MQQAKSPVWFRLGVTTVMSTFPFYPNRGVRRKIMSAVLADCRLHLSKGFLSREEGGLLNDGVTRFYQLRFFLVLFLLVGLVVGIEQFVTRFFGDQTLAPLLSLIMLAMLAYFFSFRQVLIAVPIFTSLSYLMIMDSSRYPLVRASTVMVGGLVALWATRQRSRLAAQVEEVESVLQSLPVPWMLSDSSGVITRHSITLPHEPGKEGGLVGTSFFSYFNLMSKKDFIRDYMDSFERGIPLPTITLNPSHNEKYYQVNFVFLSQREGRRILSILQGQGPNTA